MTIKKASPTATPTGPQSEEAASKESASRQEDQRWAAVIATLATAGLYYWLPERLTPGPSWLIVLLILGSLVLAIITQRLEKHDWNRILGFVLLSIVTLTLVWSLGMLIQGLPSKRESPQDLLRAAVALWTSNVLVFASWYWRLDAGGPHSRSLRPSHTEGAFLFPQMTMPSSGKSGHDWKPNFVDYLFLAFNTSTAFSPTDVPVLSRWAKGLMMIQSCLSLAAIAILGARAINIL